MPIYEYVCQACGMEIEALQKMSDAPLVDCPGCAKPALQKKISAAGFRLKGGGWYETDFKKDKKRNIAQSADDTGKSTVTGTSENKPAKTPESGKQAASS
jgi:putative FmdB family regulatory protein